MRKILLYLKNMDWLMTSSVLLLIAFGLAEIYSVSLGRGGVDIMNFKKQLWFVLIGLGLMFFLALFDYHNLRSLGNWFYVFGVLGLLAVLVFGKVVNGTRGWFYIFGFGIQPVEIIKFILVLFLARYFSSHQLKTQPVRHLLLSGLSVLLLFLLVLLQPDFGSAMLLFVIWLMIVVLAGMEKRYLFYLGGIFLIIFTMAWSFYFKEYQKHRIMTFVNPSFNALDQGYNVAQAIIAVGSGGLFGRGIGFGSQSQLKFLPESQTDFIFAVISEELGFFGVCLLLIFFAIFLFRCLMAVRKANNDFGIYFILGVSSLIFVEMFINIGMNIGLLPVVGIALPFVSYGGSSMISNLMFLGVIQSIVIRSKL